MAWNCFSDGERYEKCTDPLDVIVELSKAFDLIYQRVDRNSHTYNRMYAEFIHAIKKVEELQNGVQKVKSE